MFFQWLEKWATNPPMLGKLQDALSSRWRTGAIVCLLFGATIWLFWPATGYDFTNFDDHAYVAENRFVQEGLAWHSVRWAFGQMHEDYWIPLTWLSYLADTELYGTSPRGYHLTNIVLHAANAVLLFLWLARATRQMWAAAWVAALFAFHPLRVESVAWVSERKDVLSALFLMLALHAYLAYARSGRRGSYMLVALAMLLSLMAKPMFVTLPFLLLLLDYWPLRRAEVFRLGEWKSLLLEKLPLLGLSLVFAALTFATQKWGGTIRPLEQFPWDVRLASMPVAYVFYVAKTVWPMRLSVVYPTPTAISPGEVAVCTGILAVLSLFFLWAVRRNPAPAVGWLMFLGLLVPVIGLVRVGSVFVADRFSYIPQIGLFVAGVWGAMRLRRGLRLPLALGALAACAMLTRLQLPAWQNSLSLYARSLDAVGDNYLCHNNLGCALKGERRFAEALLHLRKAAACSPDMPDVHCNIAETLSAMGRLEEAERDLRAVMAAGLSDGKLFNSLGIVLAQEGKTEDAIQCLRRALRYDGTNAPGIAFNLALAFVKAGHDGEAMEAFDAVLRDHPDHAGALIESGKMLLSQGRSSEAIFRLERAAHVEPERADCRASLALALLSAGRREAAREEFARALRCDARHLESLNNLAWMLATDPDPARRDPPEALRLATAAANSAGAGDATVLDTLAVCYAACGQFSNALEVTQRILPLIGDHQEKLRAAIIKRRECYRKGEPWTGP